MYGHIQILFFKSKVFVIMLHGHEIFLYFFVFLQLRGFAKYENGNNAESPIDLKITVVDENDCPPVIKVQQVGYVNESSAKGILQYLQYVSIFSLLLKCSQQIYYF